MNTPILTLKVTLRHTLPRVWRRLTVPGDITLARFDSVIQAAMGWTDSTHRYFEDGNGVTYSAGPFVCAIKSGHKEKLGTILNAVGSRITYHFGFEEDWEHDVNVESLVHGTARDYHIRCIGGARRCPPDGCGGPFGFRDLLENLRGQPRQRGEFDPSEFKLSAINLALRRLRL